MKTFSILCTVMISGLAGTALAQEQAAVNIDGQNVTVKYSAPSMKGRKIFGATVPFSQPWAIGESAPAAFHTDADLVFSGLTVPKGDYTLYLLPDAAKWQLIISKQTGAKAATYNPKMDLGRISMTMAKTAAPVEKCKLTITKSAALAAKLELAWENTSATVAFRTDFAAADREW